MRSTRSGFVAGWVLVGLLVAGLATGSLQSDPPDQPSETPTTQPAATDAPAERHLSAEEAALLSARENLVSGLVDSPHDFTHGARRGRDLCLPCHTPHLVAAPPPRLDRRAEPLKPLRPYQGIDIELTGWSLLCLGCHDGVTASDVYSSPHAVDVAGQLGNSRLGTTGLRSHPVGVRYPPASEDYHPRAYVEAAGLLLPDGRIQCTTCHDAHNTYGHVGLLRISNSRSRMCMTCHRR